MHAHRAPVRGSAPSLHRPFAANPSPSAHCASPLAGGSAGAIHRGLAGARDTCGQLPISRRVLRDGACGRGRSASVHVVRAVRRGGSSSLCADSYLWVLCCGPYGAPAGATSPGRNRQGAGRHDTPPAWNARTSVGAVVLCVCGVLCWEERERAASLPVGRHCCRVVAASLPGRKASLPVRHHCRGGCACYCLRVRANWLGLRACLLVGGRWEGMGIGWGWDRDRDRDRDRDGAIGIL